MTALGDFSAVSIDGLLGRDGQVLSRRSPQTEPATLADDVENALAA